MLCFTTAVSTQMPAYTKAGPIPPALTTAKSIFVSNAGSSNTTLFRSWYKGDEDRPYTEFYAALKATGSFTLVNDPAQADLVLEISLISSHQAPDMFRLVVYDTKTHYIFWTITRGIDFANREDNRERNFDTALSDVLNQF
ncbi:MAG: hypothetical protein ACRD3S_05310, partial [Terracidiphilus sp.]